MMKDTRQHTFLPNLLDRKFKQETPRNVLLTDITYLFSKNGQNAYLSIILDASTNEVLAYNISKSLKIDIVTNTIDKLMKNTKDILSKEHLFTQIKGFTILALFFKKKLRKVN